MHVFKSSASASDPHWKHGQHTGKASNLKRKYDTVQINKMQTPVFATLQRISLQSAKDFAPKLLSLQQRPLWAGLLGLAPARQFQLLSCQVTGLSCSELGSECSGPLGIEGGIISNQQITASSTHRALFGLQKWYPYYARLNKKGLINAWTAAENDRWPWIQFLGKPAVPSGASGAKDESQAPARAAAPAAGLKSELSPTFPPPCKTLLLAEPPAGLHFLSAAPREINLQRKMRVTGLITQGAKRIGSPEYIKSYKIAHSNDGKTWTVYKMKGTKEDRVFRGNVDNNTPYANSFTPPIKAQYVRLYPQVCRRHCTLRMELLGCELAGCSEPLGMKSGHIQDYQITASSVFRTLNMDMFTWEPRKARLDKQGKVNAWTSGHNDQSQWLQLSTSVHDTTQGTTMQPLSNLVQEPDTQEEVPLNPCSHFTFPALDELDPSLDSKGGMVGLGLTHPVISVETLAGTSRD
ncbi:EGF-like repeat and discoidin I-like domain-containing protein 3 [Fukomys damarensis]|uniref:EGF-like repeat and discoidin I-like domain-containing protein 3 n=1 Tax=Fukomys damarensis TaxID=885580 RepID=A0A091D9P5_FUKDA|nr:EGF-like repeat and discoidin I-like domain-containing protein 3 [Fukomys damarensis]